ncbi:MAG: hypothetical protein HC848_01530 [Limnobacter sp.]|nr:hypothetical protein [Limnobacter sp.]
MAVFGKHKSPAHQKQWRDVALLLIEKQFKVLVHEDSCKMSATECKNDPRFQFATLETIRSKADFAVIIGGDGTFLGVARALVCANIPLLGINQGVWGF